MNNLKAERERIKIQKQLYKENKLMREQKEKELNKEIPIIIPTKAKKQLDGSQFSSISLEKLRDNSITEDVSLTDMLGIKTTDAIIINNNSMNEINNVNETNNKLESDRHYAPDFI
jgi:hypothetical protein